MNPETQIERLERLGLLKEEDIPELGSPITTWKSAMARAKEGDPSQFALLLTHGHIPKPLTDDVYRLVIDAPWKELPKGGQKTLTDVQKGRVQKLYALGHLIGGRNRTIVLEQLSDFFRVSTRTIQRAIAENGSLRTRAPSAKKRASVAPKGRQRRVKPNSR
jgi:hypothetical protein